MITDKIPGDIIALHYALKNKKFMMEMSKSIKPEYFNQPFRDFYSALRFIFADPSIKEVLSLPALLDYCGSNSVSYSKDIFTKIYNYSKNLKIDGEFPNDGDFAYFLNVLKTRHNNNLIANLTAKLSDHASDTGEIKNINKLIDNSLREINSIYSKEVFDEGSVGADIDNMYNEYKAIAGAPDTFKGVLSHFPSLDMLTNGFFGGELIIIAGFEGTGKSILCHNFAVNAWLGSNRIDSKEFVDDGKNIVYFTLEMPRSNRGEFTSGAYLNKRIISCVSGLPFSDLRKGALRAGEEDIFTMTCDFIKKYDKFKKFYVVDIPRGATLNDIESKYLEVREKFDIDMVVIDYIGLMEGADDQDNPDWETIGKIAAGLHEFARIYHVPVISPVQVNRPSGTNHSMNKQNYNTTRIARSAMITQNANIVLQIGCRDQEEQYPDMPIYIVKMRDAPKGILSFAKDFGKMRVSDSMSGDLDGSNLEAFENLSIGE